MRTKIRFCNYCSQFPVAANLAGVLEQTGWELTVEFGKEVPPGEFAIYQGDKMIFSRHRRGKMLDCLDNIPTAQTGLYGEIAINEAGHGPG